MELGCLLRAGNHRSSPQGGILVFKEGRLTPNEDFCRERVSDKLSKYTLFLDSVHRFREAGYIGYATVLYSIGRRYARALARHLQ